MDLLTDHNELQAERSDYDCFNKRVPAYQEYARGEQPCLLSENQHKILRTNKENERSNNRCHLIIADTADRIELQGFDVDDDQPGAAQLRAFFDEVWIKCALADLQGEVNYNLARDGNSAVFVEWVPNGNPATPPDYGRINLRVEDWWDGEQGVWIFPGNEFRPAYAVKEVWTFPNGRAKPRVKVRFVYYEDRVERFQSTGGFGSWEPYKPPSDPEGARAVTIWTKTGREGGPPLHIPFVHFPNAGRMFGAQGLSELHGGILAMQDELNTLDASETGAGILTAFQVLGMRGYTAERDPTDERRFLPPKVNMEAGGFFYDASKDFDVWAVPAGSVEQVKLAKDDKIADMATASRTPRHSITGGDWPSGEALDRAERPAVNKAKRIAAKIGPSWATVMHRATEQANVFGKRALNEDLLIVARFGDFERRDPMYVLQVEEKELQVESLRKAAGEPDKSVTEQQ